MFFIITSGQKEQKLDFEQIRLCKNCDRYGNMHVYMIYSYLSFFFIPILKWNKRYYAKMECCHAVCELDQQLGKQIQKGMVTSIDDALLHFVKYNDIKVCHYCGFETKEDYAFCPHCGNKM